MSIKSTLTKAAEKITGRKCTRCLHNCKGRCCHPDGRMFMRCWQSITRPGFKRREKTAQPAPGDLTNEELHQLQKIVATLDEAETTARESGLLTED